MEQELWDVAADMAVENAILSLGISGMPDNATSRKRRFTKIRSRDKPHIRDAISDTCVIFSFFSVLSTPAFIPIPHFDWR